VPVLADEESPTFLPPAFEIPASMWFDQERTLDAFRTGAGIPWGDHDQRLSCGVAGFYRNAYAAAIVPEWLPGSTASSRSWSGERVWPTSAAATAIRRC
jgi:hypothetical protein